MPVNPVVTNGQQRLFNITAGVKPRPLIKVLS
jgi:hypothetical protein